MLSGQGTLESAAKLSDITKGDHGPFEMEGDFTAQVNTSLTGHFVYRWKAKNEWWRKITMGGFEQIEVFKGDTRSIVRNMNFEPERVTELKDLLWNRQSYDDFYIRKQKNRKVHGVAVSCAQLEDRQGKGEVQEVCFNPVLNQIVSEGWKLSELAETKREYADFISFDGYQIASRLTLREGPGVMLSARITSLKAAEFDDALFAPPPGAIERRECEGIKAPEIINRPPPQALELEGPGGITRLFITVGVDGSITEAHVIGRSTKEMDEKILKSLHDWKYRPALCGNVPVVADLMVSIAIYKQ